MDLLDLILVSVLLPATNALEPTINDSCGFLDVNTPDFLFYERNSTITFIPATVKNASPQLIDAYDHRYKYNHQLYDNKTHEFTFILLQTRTATDRYRAYRVKYDNCTTGAIGFALHERPTLGPRKDTEGCHGCLIVQMGENVNKNSKAWISCSISNDIPLSVNITINNKTLHTHVYSKGKYYFEYTVQDVDNMSIAVCFMTIGDRTLNDTARLYVQGLPSTPSQSTKPEVTSVASSLTTSSAQTTQSSTATEIQHVNVTNVTDQTQSSKTVTEKNNRLTSTKSTTDRRAGSTTKELFSTTQRVVLTSSPSAALKTTENFISTTNTGHGKNDKRTKTTSTTKSQPFCNDANTDKIDTSVLNPSTSNDGFQNVIIAVACAVSALIIVIAVVIAVVCVKRKRRSLANVPLQDTPREDQVAQEEGYASIGDSECQYAVVNKPKKQSTLQVKQDPPVENKPMEMQSNPEKPSGAGELIYADLDKEALKAKPSNSKPAGTLERPRTPTEYVGIDFARTVALQDANKLEE